VGNEIFGRLVDNYTVDTITDWRTVWAWPAVAGVTALMFFIVLFRENKSANEKQV